MAIQVTKERAEAYVEILEILKHMDEKYVEKVPLKLREFFERNSSKDYEFELNTNKPLAEQNLKPKTLSVLGMINVNYWCENEERKNKLLEKYQEEENLYQEELQRKYSSKNIFQNNKVNVQENFSVSDDVAMVEVKESFFRKILNKIKKFFNKV